MPVIDLSFTVLDAAPEPYAAAPALLFRMRAAESTGAAVHAMALRVQITIEPQRRRYDDPGASHRPLRHAGPVGGTLRPFLWTHASTMVPGFTGGDRLRPAGAVHVRLRGRRGEVPARTAATARCR